ncbi:MAG: hypothetical protein AAB545_03340 [Patescibacteria group bacterium]
MIRLLLSIFALVGGWVLYSIVRHELSGEAQPFFVFSLISVGWALYQFGYWRGRSFPKENYEHLLLRDKCREN